MDPDEAAAPLDVALEGVSLRLGGERLVVAVGEHERSVLLQLRVVDSAHVASAGVPTEFEWTDEFYFTDHLNPGIHPVLVADRTKLQFLDQMKPPASSFPNPTPLAWWQTFDGGREFYIAIGHDKESYTNPILTTLITNAIVWATTKP